MAQQTVGILIFDEVEILDFCGPFEVFSSAVAEGEDDRDARRLYRAFTIAETTETVQCRGGLLVQPNHTIDVHPPLDILVVPGGFGTRQVVENPRLLDWIARQNVSTTLTTSVCTGAFVLARTGLLDGKRATTHWAAIDELRATFPAVVVVDDERVIDEGKIITSAGVSAGIDMALYVVARQHGQSVAADTARGMEYEPSAFSHQL
jgi:transcriptional regulator GlxA family with amidase domain